MTDDGFDLEGRRALVTGASTGIGAAIAERLVAHGAAVVGVSRSGQAPPDVIGLAADLADDARLDRVVDDAVGLLGGLDIVVNNAGRADWAPVLALDRQAFDATIALNLWAPLRLTQLAHPHLAARGDACVVMVGSIDARRPSPGGAVYGATKAGLGAVTVALAKEWRADGIRVVQVDPGLVETPLAVEAVAALERDGRPINLVGRPGRPAEVAGLVHYVVSPLGRFVNGTSLVVDGGALASGPFDAIIADD